LKNKNTLKETIEKKARKEKYIKILLATILCISLLSTGFVIGNPRILSNIKGSLDNIIKKDTSTAENNDAPEIVEIEEKELKNTEDITDNPIKEEPPIEESSRTQKNTSAETITPTETEPTTPTLKCTQYEYDYATAFIPAATEVYNDLYNSYQEEVTKYQNCMFGYTYNELYEICDSELSDAIRNPLTRDEFNQQCIQRYYSDCEMNDSRDWYATQMENKLATINEQKAILESCY